MARAPSKSVATRNNTSVANIQEQLKQEVAALGGQVGAISGNKIKTENKVFTFPDGSTSNDPISLVVVDFVSYNVLYRNKFEGKKYDANDRTPPMCFAIGKTIKDMRPSPNAPEPQADSCAECPMNQFGSDGAGKVCTNTRRLAVLSPDDVDPQAELMLVEVSPTALKRFDAFVSTVAKLHELPPIGVSVEVGFDDSVTYPSLTFSSPEPNQNIAVHFARRSEAEMLLTREPDLSVEAAPTTARGRAPAKKAAAGRGARGRSA